MSLAQSRIKGPLGMKRYESPRKSQMRPRFLKSMSFTSLHDHDAAITKLHGDATPQTPMHYNQWLKFGKTDLLKEAHPRPWSSSSCPGKKSSDDANHFHRVWITDMQRQGKWTRREKAEYYEKQDQSLRASTPHNETMAARMPRNGAGMHWIAMRDRGSKVGGYEKLDITPPRPTGLHMKHGQYKGVFENVKPYQYVNKTGRKDDQGQPDEVEPDEREMVDTQMLDDNLSFNWRDVKWSANSSWDTFRPFHTHTCSTMGIYFTHR